MRALLLLLAGCNQVLGIDPTLSTPDEVAPDVDEDDVPDAADNCPTVANPDQRDIDLDGPGDDCDNCPLTANTPQSSIADSDAVGDDCDPHPTVDGDCLVLLDRFSDPAAFAEHWLVQTAPVFTPIFEHTPDGLQIELAAGQDVGLIATTAGSVIAADFDLVAAGRTKMLQNGSVLGTVNAGALDMYYACGMVAVNPDAPTVYARAKMGTSSVELGTRLSSAPVRDEFTLRTTARRTGGLVVHCRVDYGVAIGAVEVFPGSNANVPTGGAGMLLRGPSSTTLRAITLYQPMAGACPQPIIR